MGMECKSVQNRPAYLDRRCYPIPKGEVQTKNNRPPRIVPPFSAQSRQKNTTVQPFPKSAPKKKHPVGMSTFRKHYLRGDIPIAMEFDNYGYKVSWKANIEELDYHHYLPLFFDGLCEVEHPFKFFAQQGIHDLIMYGKGKINPVLPQIILPIKNALNTGNKSVIATTLKVLQDLVICAPEVGEPLICYYRQILPPLNIYKDYNENFGDEVDYSQRRRENIGDLVHETLEILERAGGQDAFINIKYLIPTYESCMYN